MKKSLNFANRCFKEIIRDPLGLIFAICLPLFLLFIFQQFEIPGAAYSIENFTPGIMVFGFSFITMFTATLVAKDRSSAFLARLGVSPIKAHQLILGYTLSVIPMVIIQGVLFFGLALCLGLELSLGIFYTVLAATPVSLLFIFLGVLVGCVTTERAASGVASVVVQLVAFTSGMYFDASILNEGFATVCKILPFSACVDILKYCLGQSVENILLSVSVLAAYTVGVMALACTLFWKFRKNL